jgi:5-methylcytosine-specific restriction endonuclease McrA
MPMELKTYSPGKSIPKNVQKEVYKRAHYQCEQCGRSLNRIIGLDAWEFGILCHIEYSSETPTANTVKLLCYECYKKYKRKVEEHKRKTKVNTSTKKSYKKRPRTPCPKSVKEALWRKYFGNNLNGKCYVCGKYIDYTSFEVGHNKPFSKGGEWNINNLRPLCRSCNRSMGTMTAEKYKKKYFS